MSETKLTGGTPNPEPVQPVAPVQNTPNNTGGDDADLANFWEDDPVEQQQGVQQTQQPAQQQQQQQQQQQPQSPQDVNAALQAAAHSIAIPDVMNEQVMRQLAESDVTGFNQALKTSQQQTAQALLQMTGQMLVAMRNTIKQDIETQLQQGFTTRDNSAFLENEIPGVDVTAKPIVQAMFGQALKKAKGNREKAIQTTRKMMRKIGLNVGTADQQQGKEHPPTNWAQEFGLIP